MLLNHNNCTSIYSTCMFTGSFHAISKVADHLKDCSGDSRHVFVSLGYAVLDAEKKDEVEMLFKVLCGEGALEMVSKFLPQSAQVSQYMYMEKHNPAHWSKCKTWSDW